MNSPAVVRVIETLLKDARKQETRARKAFEKDDNIDDMHEMEHWQHAIEWLEEKL